MLSRLRVKNIHFAWDKYEDKEMILPKFQMFKEISGWNYRKMTVFVLTNFNSIFEQDLERVYLLRDMGYNPYIMIYDKAHTTGKDNVRKLQRWVNNRILFRTVDRFEDYAG